MRRILKQAAVALLLAAALSLPVSAPASAASPSTPCWQLLMNQWYQGEITTVFPLDCYHQAIQHLPTDISVYSSAREDITKALNAAIAYDQQAAAAAAASSGSTGTTGATTTTKKTLTVPVIKTSGPGSSANGIVPSTLNSGSGGATSFPLPLLILGGLAILLVAAGGVGLLVRRMQSRGSGS